MDGREDGMVETRELKLLKCPNCPTQSEIRNP